MKPVELQQIRLFRLHQHHLDQPYTAQILQQVVGACGLQNTPPGTWEIALHQRIPSLTQTEIKALLYKEKCILQAWSFRGNPIIFPVEDSDVFLTALISNENEEWIYTHGITLALKAMQMSFHEAMTYMLHVVPSFHGKTIVKKAALDQYIADLIQPYLSDEKQRIWSQPSMYGANQTIGGAIVSFLLRPCSLMGYIVFGERYNTSPTFVSYEDWIGHSIIIRKDTSKRLVRKFLHCYGPSNVQNLAAWLGCSFNQAKRLWSSIVDEIMPVPLLNGKTDYLLKKDIGLLYSPVLPVHDFILLSAHDPYLEQRDREVLLPDITYHSQVWQTVSNPGVILFCGEIIAIWRQTKEKKGFHFRVKRLINNIFTYETIHPLFNQYAAFYQLSCLSLIIEEA